MKRFLWMGLLAFGLQTSRGFSLLGPVGNEGGGTEDSFQVVEIGYNPLPAPPGPPFFTDDQHSGPKNIGEGYRLNVPVLYYTFDPSFGYFGSDGETAVQQAFDMLNSLTNVDSYSTDLSEFPLNSQSVNYQARALGLADLKSATLSLMVEVMGLADSVRYTWALIDRYNPPGSTCPQGGPSVGYDYYVIMRNSEYYLTPLNYNPPDWGQYSPYVNNELYSYYIYDNCDAPYASPPAADALEFPVDPINRNSPVASGHGEDALPTGSFYTGLTRDDAAGLRYLFSTNNIFAPSAGYRESSAAGSTPLSGGGGGNWSPLQLTTFSLAILPITDPVTLQTEVPGIVITSVTTNSVNGQYSYTFGNLVTNSFATNTTVQYQIQTTTITQVSPPVGYPIQYYYGQYGLKTNTSTTGTNITSNTVSGDFYVVPTNSCGLTILTNPPPTAIVVSTTNNLGTVTITNQPAVGDTTIISTNIVTFSTNHILSALLCTPAPGTTNNSTSVVGDFQGIGRVQFVRVSDTNYDYQTGRFIQPITNQYSMVLMRNGQFNTVTFQRVVTRPDILFIGRNISIGNNDAPFMLNASARTTPGFVNSRAPNFSGPGIIDPTVTDITITFNTVGPIYVSTSPTSLNGPVANSGWSGWGSFDGSTNAPILYPNGTSIANLAAEALIQIFPATLPDGTNTYSYGPVTLLATGGQTPYTWSLAPGSAGLPPGLALSAGGVISGTPTASGTFDNIFVRMTDTATFNKPSYSVDTTYSITIH